jgi:drug/metabolite transporter (DMT)-like permease
VPFIEYGEHVLGVTIVILLLFLVDKTQKRNIPQNGWAIAAFIAIALYWLCWALYFSGIQPNPVIYAMVILPPIAFFSAGAAEKVWPISAVSIVFLVFHLLVALENFPIRL